MIIRAFLILALLVALPVHGEEINAGFVQGLWYSSQEITADNPVRVYAALRNNTPHDLTGTVRFTDNGKRIGSAPVSALSGRLVETWIDWTPSYGSHSLSVNLSDAELHVIGGDTIQADVASITVSDTLDADYDTDKDGTGDKKDLDDDNDTVSDEEELKRGTNPLIPNPKVEEKKIVAEEIALTPTPPAKNTETETAEGLEQYLDDGVASSLLENVTDKVHDAKQSLDDYRKKRSEELSQEEILSDEASDGDYAQNATITRSKIETGNTLLSGFVSGVRELLQGMYTGILWVTSHTLAYPALIQVLLLVGILYMFYRTARRLSGRPF